MLARALATDCLDLVLARSCLRCGRLGRVLCPTCLAGLRGQVSQRPLAGGPVPAFAALPYDPVGRELIVDYKERGNRALAPMLGVLLADAVEGAARTLGTPACQLVPVPAHRRSMRGFDALAGIVRSARRELSRRGLEATVVPAIRSTRHGIAMKSLTLAERRAQATTLFRLSRAPVHPDLPVVVVDDVVTTGSTLLAMCAALATADVPAAAAACITAVSVEGRRR